MHHHIVDASTTVGELAGDPLLGLFVSTEEIQGQRFRFLFYKADRLIDRIVGDDRENRSEDLLLHDGRGFDHIDQEGRGDPFAFGIDLSAVGESAILEEGNEPIERGIGDDRGIIRIVQRIQSPQVFDRIFQTVEKLGKDFPFDQHVVGGDACLSGIKRLSPDDPLGGESEVGGSVDDRRAFASEFQGDGRQVFACALHDELADSGRTGEEDMIERKGKEISFGNGGDVMGRVD